jgi:hypothetical protein
MIETYVERRLRLMLPHATGQPCPLCGVAMTPGQAGRWQLELDTTGDRVLHAACKGAEIDEVIRRGRSDPDYPGP